MRELKKLMEIKKKSNNWILKSFLAQLKKKTSLKLQ
jgi:hypothetical protein